MFVIRASYTRRSVFLRGSREGVASGESGFIAVNGASDVEIKSRLLLSDDFCVWSFVRRSQGIGKKVLRAPKLWRHRKSTPNAEK
jgi:hypothetical protein